jgi:hypothetical protein
MAEHTHETALEAKICHGLVKVPAPTPVYVPPPAAPSVRHATPAQIKYATDLGGDPVRIARCDFYSISSYIDELKRGGAKVTTQPVVNPKLEFVKSMLLNVDSGYYAVRTRDDGSDKEIFFMRISRPKSGQYKGTLKVQSCHGGAGIGSPANSRDLPVLMDGVVLWPSGRTSFYGRYNQAHWQEVLVDSIMKVVTDAYGALRLYSEQIKRCCRCNAGLTDDNSRHYGIGPECEKYWPHIIEMVDAADALRA